MLNSLEADFETALNNLRASVADDASRIASEQMTAFCAVSDDRKQTTCACVFWRVRRDPGTVAELTRCSQSPVSRAG